MQVETSADYPDDFLVLFEDLKFIVVDQCSERKVILSDSGRSHTKMLPADGILVGAGFVYKNNDVKWGSTTCVQARGYDRPSDPEEATRIAMEVRTAIETWKIKYK